MPVITVENDLQFFYTDSGVPGIENYTTIIFIHGHTFHSGIFQRLADLARAQSLRVICVNRREYPGTSPYTPQELNAIQHGTEAERRDFFHQQGVYIGLFVDGVIKTLSLPRSGGIVLAGWSMGSAFLVALLAGISKLPAAIRARLQTYVRQVIFWDLPSQSLGAPSPPGGYVPLWDEELPPQDREPAFGKWVASYFHHDDLASRDVSKLNQRNPDIDRKSTIETMTQEELFSAAEFAPGPKCETILVEPAFAGLLVAQIETLFDQATMKEWGGTKFWGLYGSAVPWNVIYGWWILEKKAGPSGAMNFKLMEGANHFFMWEDPARALEYIQECIKA